MAKAGDVATAQQVEIIKALNAYNLSNPNYPLIIGTFLIVLLLLVVGYQLITQRVVRGPRGIPRRILLSLLILVSLALAVNILASQLQHR